MNKMKKIGLWLTLVFILISRYVDASDIGSSKIATGTQKLITDATTWLMGLSPVVAIVCIVYYLIRKGMSDEVDHKKWNSRIMVAIVCCIGAVVASVLINVLVSYYQ
jgi:nitric oxide reductase large subunit